MENAWVPSFPMRANDGKGKDDDDNNDPLEVVCQRRMLTFIDAHEILEITRNDSLPEAITYLSLESNSIPDAGIDGISM
jgi:hypothetical protein